MAFMGLCLLHRNEQVRGACTAVQMRCDGNKILASSDIAQLEAEKKSLTQKIESLHQFLDSRVIWTSNLHNVMARFPPSIRLTSFSGGSGLQIPGPGKRTLQLGASINLLPRGAVPPDVFKLIASFRNDAFMKQNFDKVDLGNISPSGTAANGDVKAGFSISCQSTR
jgi:Tfp pilus assembly protein PilN